MIRPSKRHGFKAYCGVDNLYNLTYTYLKWRIELALILAKLEPYCGYLHGIAKGRPALLCDFLELYRYIMDNHVLEYARKVMLRTKHFALKKESYSSGKIAMRQYLRDDLQKAYWKSLDNLFLTKLKIARMRRGKTQTLSTLINEEALLFAQYLRNEKQTWVPRIVSLAN
jgi:CRISPR/Cas system-associated endonuclease Cas1